MKPFKVVDKKAIVRGVFGSRSYNIEANGQTYTRNWVDSRKTEERWEEVENNPSPSSIRKKTDGNCRKELNLKQNIQEQERERNEGSSCNEKSDVTMLNRKDSAYLLYECMNIYCIYWMNSETDTMICSYICSKIFLYRHFL